MRLPERIRLKLASLTQKQILAILLMVFLLFIFVIVSARGGGTNKIDTPSEGEIQDFKTRAKITNGDELFRVVGGGTTYDQAREDIFAFGKANYASYKKSSNKIVGFEVNSKSLNKKNSTISFDGKYGSSSNKVHITIQLLKYYSRIKTSITDTRTKNNIDSKLPSNSKRNQFIMTLPVSQTSFELDYNDTTDTFNITSYNGSNETVAVAEAFLKSSLGVKDLSKENYTFYTPGSDISGQTPTPFENIGD